MGWIKRSWDWLTLADVPAHRFAAESAPRPVDQVIFEMKAGDPGYVGRDEALSVPAVLRGRNLICSIATLPLIQVNRSNQPQEWPLLEQIDPAVANAVTLAQTIEDLLFEAEAWWRVTERDALGFPLQARHLSPTSVSMMPPTGATNPLPSNNDPRGATVWVDGVRTPARDLIRFDSPNPPLLRAGARAIRRALMLDRTAELYADGGRPLDYFTPAEIAGGRVDPGDDDLVRSMLDDWRVQRKRGATAYVPAFLDYHQVDAPTPADLQLVALQQRAALDIANALGLDPEDLGISTTSRTYSNVVDRRRDRINDVLSPYMKAITDRLSMPSVTPKGNRVVFDLDDYLRADPRTRYDVYEKAIGLGILSPEEARAEEGLPPGAPTPRPVAAPTPLRQVASGGKAMNFDNEPVTFADVPVLGFAVDREKRTISGRALPYGETATKSFRTFSFLPGSMQWNETSRVKLLRDHDYSQAIGKAVELTDADGGFDVVFSVARGPAGDEALSLAEDGVLDGFSVGVDFDPASDAEHRDGVYFVRRANLREVSLVAIPAFDSARITRVTASRDQEGATVPDEQPTTATHAPAAVGAQFTAQDVNAFLAAIKAQAAPPPPVGPVDTPLNLSRVEVTEPVPYRFDAKGNLREGSHDFSTDLVNGFRENGGGDLAARDRAQTFIREQFDIDRADVASLNPTIQRPDMYVDQRSYRYPVWEAISKGSLSDSRAFQFPKFNSSTIAVTAHTEGVEPTGTTMTTTNQTVTPTALSGKVELTREAFDQGGNPQISGLIWRQMTKSWYEGLEARAVAVLDAATPAALATFTAGGGTNKGTLVSELTAGLASLQFVRGGFSMDTMFLQVDLYKDLIAAKDGNARPIYPALGPQNTYGTVRDRFGAIEVAPGVVGLPAWALAASGSVAASSYLFDSDSVWGWASNPQRLEFNWRVAYVDIAIWGYAATAITDINGVREITYDPVA